MWRVRSLPRATWLIVLLMAAALLASAPAMPRASMALSEARYSVPEEPFSPLYSSRLSISLEAMDRPEAVQVAGRFNLVDDTGFVASANPLSVCLGSACSRSYCLGSLCVGSGCLGSACGASQCLGSACAGSACGGSVCIASGCLGSVCGGSVCVGTMCGRGCALDPNPDQESHG
jgi:hypothetical protein